MNVLSLFDGIGCGKLALERAGIEVNQYFASEIEPVPIAMTSKNHPDTIHLGDVTKWREWQLPRIDLILAGSPCQGFSRNGKNENFEDQRSILFFEFVKILDWIKENNNPDVKFLLENVEMRKRSEDIVSFFVNEEPHRINSSLLSAQKRPRLYWTNIKGVEMPEDAGINLEDIIEPDADESLYLSEKELAGKPLANKGQEIYRFITAIGDNLAIVRNGTKQGYLIAKSGDSINLSVPNSKTRRGRVGEKKSNTLDTHCNQGVFLNGRVRRFTMTELERLQTLPDGYTEGFSDSARKKAIGNGWTVDVVAHILSHMTSHYEKE